MVFGIVHQVCSEVPGHDVPLFNAVPHQHGTLEHFDQTGAAVHPALFTHCAGSNVNIISVVFTTWYNLLLGQGFGEDTKRQ
jgi:hypothetical protein